MTTSAIITNFTITDFSLVSLTKYFRRLEAVFAEVIYMRSDIDAIEIDSNVVKLLFARIPHVLELRFSPQKWDERDIH